MHTRIFTYYSRERITEGNNALSEPENYLYNYVIMSSHWDQEMRTVDAGKPM